MPARAASSPSSPTSVASVTSVTFPRIALAFVVVLGTVIGSTGCGRALEPANKPIDACVKSCGVRASRQCSEAECARGCEFILDRIVEKEGENVLACVARTARRCTDVVWADCAAHVGVHADGGPPAPAPPQDED